MKKLFLATFIAMLCAVVQWHTAQAAESSFGANLVSTDGTVYTISEENGIKVRRAYTSPGAFTSYNFNRWENVTKASSFDMQLPVGSLIPPRDGKVICSDRGVDRGTCYLITGKKKAGFTSESVFRGLGYDFSKASSGDVSFLESTAVIDTTNGTHLPGTLVNYGGTIFLVTDSGLTGIPEPDVLLSWGYTFTDIVNANEADKKLPKIGVLTNRPFQQLTATEYSKSNNNTDRPKLSLSRDSVDIEHTLGNNLQAVKFSISNPSSTQSATVNVSILNKPKWISTFYNIDPHVIQPKSELNLEVAVDPNKAGPGTHTYVLRINGDFQNSPLQLPIKLVVKEPSNTNTNDTSTSAFSITTSSLPDATIGEAYSAKIYVKGGTAPYQWWTESTTYPSGCCVLGLNGTDKPTSENFVTFNTQSSKVVVDSNPAGKYTWIIKVKDASGKVIQKTISLNINSSFSITTSTLPKATIGQPYSTKIYLKGGTAPYKWFFESTTYPSGCCVLGVNDPNTDAVYNDYVTFNTQTSSTVVDSNPPGQYYWNYKVTDAKGNVATKKISLQIVSKIEITTTSLPDATIGQPYSTKIYVSGGEGPYTWQTISNTLYSGCCILGLANNGDPSGNNYVTFNTQALSTVADYITPDTYYWTVEVRDKNGVKAEKTISIRIKS